MISSHVRAVCGGLEMICNDLIFTEDSLSVNNFADVSRQDVMLKDVNLQDVMTFELKNLDVIAGKFVSQ